MKRVYYEVSSSPDLSTTHTEVVITSKKGFTVYRYGLAGYDAVEMYTTIMADGDKVVRTLNKKPKVKDGEGQRP